jgi:DNA-binding phage protein
VKEWRSAYRKKFSQHLRKLINESDRDIATIASIGNIENKTIYRILADENEPKITTILPIAKGLGIHPKELYNFTFSVQDIEE